LPVSRLPIFFREKAPSVIELSSYQEKAFTSIQQQFEFFNTVLLHGVTGSGKTEIYIKLIQEEIDKGKQVLYLLPEIALTTQIINRLRKYFGNKVGVYHSRFNESERVEIWQEVLSRDESSYQIIIGARSALFLPFYNLGLIIVDEEHDVSYKQFEPNPHYHARDSAMVLAQIHKAKTLLGSATPSIETYYNTVKNKFGLVTLHQRFGGLALPEIKIIDIKKEGRNEQGYSPYTKSLLHHIEKALERKEQVILFQNRRGFSVHLECKVCNFIPSCKNCDVTLTYHKTINQLRCHYCGYSENVPKACDMCKNSSMEMRGTGTEKIEEDLQIIFPSANITRLDYDSTRSKTAYQHIISNFENRKIDILVGTQMITKGLDFDNVSTVGILNADNMLFYPDFRSFERAYQLIAQVSGRAGRKNKQGIVLLQTFNPGHPIFQYVLNNDYFSLFEKTLLERKQFNYPPICRFIKITLKHKKNENLNHLAEEFAILLRKIFPNKVLGPEYPPIIKLKNMYQKDIILKIYPSKNLPLCKREIKKIISLPLFKSIQIHIDVDPY
jgi:primosomal protein N' (replication factor Y)